MSTLLALAFSWAGISLLATGIGALAVLAFMRGWTHVAIGLAAAAAVHVYSGSIYQAGEGWCEAKRAADLAQFERDIATAQVADDLQRQQNQATLAAKERQIERLTNELEAPDGTCFSPDDTERLRQLWR